MMKTRYGRCLVLASLLGLLTACGTIEHASRQQELQAVLKNYEHTVRWGRIESLGQYLQPELLAHQPPVARDPDNVRVISYEVVSPPVMITDDKVQQMAKIQYLFKDRQVVKTLMDRQDWAYDAQMGGWLRANAIPSFR